jgi:hypothetical protein
MKLFKTILIVTVIALTLSSCSIFRTFFGGSGGPKSGCPSNGKNVGAERLVEDNPKGKKKDKIPKAPKYKLDKF